MSLRSLRLILVFSTLIQAMIAALPARSLAAGADTLSSEPAAKGAGASSSGRSGRVPATMNVPAGERIALLIANSEYDHTGKLKNPLNDARAISQSLAALGFEVEIVENADRRSLGKAIKAFGQRADQSEIALLYYSGHGMELNGRNFLIPIDAELADPDDADIDAIPLETAISATGGAGTLSIVVIDACRNNTFPTPSRSAQKGFRPIAAKPNQIVSFSTAPGTVAFDGDGDVSPYTLALVEMMEVAKDYDVRILFSSLGARVAALTDGRQEPFTRIGRFGLDIVSLGARTERRIKLESITSPITALESHSIDCSAASDCINLKTLDIPGISFANIINDVNNIFEEDLEFYIVNPNIVKAKIPYLLLKQEPFVQKAQVHIPDTFFQAINKKFTNKAGEYWLFNIAYFGAMRYVYKNRFVLLKQDRFEHYTDNQNAMKASQTNTYPILGAALKIQAGPGSSISVHEEYLKEVGGYFDISELKLLIELGSNIGHPPIDQAFLVATSRCVYDYLEERDPAMAKVLIKRPLRPEECPF